MFNKMSKKIFILIAIIFVYILFRATVNIVYYYKARPVSIRGKIVFVSDRMGGRNKSFKVQLLYNDTIRPLSQNYSFSPYFSPDGSKIVYVEKVKNLEKESSQYKIFVINVLSGEKKEISVPYYRFGCSQVTFSFDQEDLLIVGHPGHNQPYQIFLYNFKTKNMIKLTDKNIIGNKTIKGIIWSARFFPDDKRILIDAEIDPPKRELFIYELESGKTIDFPYRQTYGADPAISPDGKKIAYSLHIDPDGTKYDYSEIFIMDADGSNIRKLTNNNWEDRFPCWSPDGKQICFSSFRHKTPIAGAELFVINVDGTNEKRITAPEKVHGYGGWVTDEHPDWSE